MLQQARLAVGWATSDVLRMVGALVIVRKRPHRPSAMDLAVLDAWWHVWDDDRRQHTLIQVERDVPLDTQHSLRAELMQVRASIAQLAAIYRLHAKTQSAWRAIDALLVTSWTDLEDTRPARLRRYGPVDPTVVAHLDASLTHLMARIAQMRALGNVITVSE